MTSLNNLLASSLKLLLHILLGSWVVLFSLALSSECLEVLHGVNIWLTTVLSIEVNLFSVAIEVLDEWVLSSLDILHEGWEGSLKDLINMKSMGQLLHESFLGLFGWVMEDINIEVVEFNISGVNGEVDLSLVGSQVLIKLDLILDQLLTSILQLSPEISWCSVIS